MQSSALLTRQFSACAQCKGGTLVKASVAGLSPTFSFAALGLHLKFRAGHKVLVTKFHFYVECVLSMKEGSALFHPSNQSPFSDHSCVVISTCSRCMRMFLELMFTE